MKFTTLLGALLLTISVMANNPLKVVVLDENHEPVTGAKVTAVEVSKTVYTDFDGISELQRTNKPVLYKIEYSGYNTGYVKLVPTNNDEEIRVVLEKK